MRVLTLGLVTTALAPVVFAQFGATLKPKTAEAFEQYRKQAEANMTWQPRYAQLGAGEVKVEATNGSPTAGAPSGLIHDWIGATLVENATVQQALAVLQNYAAYQKIYAPEVVESRLIKQDGQLFRVFLKLVKKKVLTAVINSEYDVEYRRISDTHWTMLSRSTRMAEVDNGREKPEGTGFGFLWRLNAYWVIQQRGKDVYLECRSISLSRDIPFGTGFLVRPFVTALPMESLSATLRQTAKAAHGQP